VSELDPRDELARRLFEAARQERPSAQARRRALLAGERDASAARALELELERGERRARRATRASGVRRSAALGATLALAAAAAWLVLHVRAPERRDAFSITPEPAEAPPRSAVAPRSVDPARVLDGPAPEPPARAVPPTASAGSRAPQPRVAPPASLAEEIALLDRARAALAAADGRRALQLVDEYERVLRGTRLRAEAELLRIEALRSSGQRARAAERARRFVAEHPGSPLADRARALGQVEIETEIEGGRR
jgi:hypothetical protein